MIYAAVEVGKNIRIVVEDRFYLDLESVCNFMYTLLFYKIIILIDLFIFRYYTKVVKLG